jgi:Lon protease-like protein
MAPLFTKTSFFLLFVLPSVLSFSPPNPLRSRYSRHCSSLPDKQLNHNHQTRLFGLAEWRDLDMGFPGTGDDVNSRLGGAEGTGLPKSLCVLPFHYTDVLLQGETKQLRLYEERFIQLFQDAMDNHCGVVAMGLIADSGIIQTVPICEIEAYNRMDDFGIFVTIRVVARAQLLEITKQTPYIKAACLEINDKVPPNLEFPNLVASNIENFMLVLSSMEHRLAKAKQERGEKSSTDEEEDEEESEMQRRINIAKLVRTVLYDTGNDVTVVACYLLFGPSGHEHRQTLIFFFFFATIISLTH